MSLIPYGPIGHRSPQKREREREKESWGYISLKIFKDVPTVYFFMVFPAYAGSDPLITIHLHVFCLMLPRFLLAKCFTAPGGTFWSLAVAGATNCCLLFLELASDNPKRAPFKHDEPLHHMINKWCDLHMTSWGHIRSLLVGSSGFILVS